MRCTLILACLVLTPFSIADDAYWSAVGGAGNFGKSKDIRMVSEQVNITLKRHSMHVRATFNFQNDGPAQTVTTAFPETITYYSEPEDRSIVAITAFKAWVDGKRVPVARKTMPLKSLDEYAKYSAVWLKEVPFAAKGQRQVVCEYESNYADGGDFIATYYILRSGATWKGNIGDCRIHVDWRQRRLSGAPLFRKAEAPIGDYNKPLRPSRLADTSADFHFKNLEPTFDLSMRCSNGFWNFRVNGKHPEDIPIGQNGEALLHGNGQDPIVDVFGGVPSLLGTFDDVDIAYDRLANDGDTNSIEVRGHVLSFHNRRYMRVDGKKRRLYRGVLGKDIKTVYVRDLVAALGGTYRYDSKTKVVYIKVPWSRYRKRR